MSNIPQWQQTASKIQDTVTCLESELKAVREQTKTLGEQTDGVRVDRIPDLSIHIGELQQDVRNLRKEFDVAIARIDKSLDWTRELWKALAPIVVTAVISTTIMGIKDYYLRPTSGASNAAPPGK